MNRFFCLMAAMATSTFVNMIYNISNAIANPVPICPNSGSSTVYSIVSESCNSVAGYWYPNHSGSKCGTNPYEWTSHCKGSYGRLGWNCSGYINGNNGGSGACVCSSSYVTYFGGGPASERIDTCGTAYVCDNGSIIDVACNDGIVQTGSAGYEGPSGCICCPAVSTALGGSFNIYANYDATAATGCYVVGYIQDETGLYQYTDDNKCYYAL